MNPKSLVEHLRGFDRWEDFETLGARVRLDREVTVLEVLDGPDMRILECRFRDRRFSLVCDDPYGHELRAHPGNEIHLYDLARRLEKGVASP